MAEEEPVSFTESVCFRPRMHTLNGTLPEVDAFLEGFDSGMASHSLGESAQQEAQFWSTFCRIACQQLDGVAHGDWHQVIWMPQAQHQDEAGALGKMAELCSLYRKQL